MMSPAPPQPIQSGSDRDRGVLRGGYIGASGASGYRGIGSRVGTMFREVWVVAALAGLALVPAQLPPATLAAHDRYVAATEQRIASEHAGQAPFLWLDRLPERERARVQDRLRRGETVVERLQTRDAGREVQIPDGLVHHWVATLLLPGTSIERASAFLRDYPRYPQAFAPLITRASPTRREADRDVVAMRTYVSKVVTVVMDGDYVIDHRQLSPTRLASKTVATNLQVVHDPGLRTERREPADQTSGNLWRYRMYCVLDARQDGL